MTDEWTFSWAGTDQAGQSRSGKLVRDFSGGTGPERVIVELVLARLCSTMLPTAP